MTLEKLMSYAKANDLDFDELRTKVGEKLRTHFLRRSEFETIALRFKATGLTPDEIGITEDDVQHWYGKSDGSNIRFAKEMYDLTGFRPNNESCENAFDIRLSSEGTIRLWKDIIERTGFYPSKNKIDNAYSQILRSNRFEELSELQRIVVRSVPKKLVQKKYTAIFEEGFVEENNDEESKRDVKYVMLNAANSMSKLFDITKIRPNISNESIQSAYQTVSAADMRTSRKIDIFEGLMNATGFGFIVSDVIAQEIYDDLLVEQNLNYVEKLSKVLGKEPVFSYNAVQAEYQKELSQFSHESCITKLKQIWEVTGIRPSKENAEMGFDMRIVDDPIDPVWIPLSDHFYSEWQEITGTSMNEKLADELISIIRSEKVVNH